MVKELISVVKWMWKDDVERLRLRVYVCAAAWAVVLLIIVLRDSL